mmetsp:Transcript_67690/g.159370  ORF Transcript_67690/g.159370 Transcript_67690/m.159370 type:complete len:241 (+) Transcript_67690:1198-1920(+)
MAEGPCLGAGWSTACGATGHLGVAALAPVAVASEHATGTLRKHPRVEAAAVPRSTRRRLSRATRTIVLQAAAATALGGTGRNGHLVRPPAQEACDIDTAEWSMRRTSAVSQPKASPVMWLHATRVCHVLATSTASLMHGPSGVPVQGLVMASNAARDALPCMGEARGSGAWALQRRPLPALQARESQPRQHAVQWKPRTAFSVSGLPGGSVMQRAMEASPCASGVWTRRPEVVERRVKDP